MKQEDFVDRHSGEEMIVVGCGPSLKNIPLGFLESRINIGVNLLRQHIPWLALDYWLALDQTTVSEYDVLPSVEGILKFIPHGFQNWFEKMGHWNDEFVSLALLDEVEGAPYSKDYGVAYSSSLPAAAQLAIEMGARRVFVTGFDCVRKGDSPGHYNLPHFYNAEIPGVYEESWDIQFGALHRHAENLGVEIINLSNPTMSRMLPKDDYRNYWAPPVYVDGVMT